MAGIGCTLPEQDFCGRASRSVVAIAELARNYGQVYGHPSSVTLQAVYRPSASRSTLTAAGKVGASTSAVAVGEEVRR